MKINKPPLDKRRVYYKEEHIFINPTRQVSGFCERDYTCGMHQQGFYEINIITRGSAEHFIGDYQYTVSVGDCFIVPPNSWHGYIGGKGFDVYHILLTQSYIEKNASELQLLPAFSSLFRVSPLMRENYSSKLRFTLTKEELNDLLPIFNDLERYSHSFETSECIHIANSEAMIVIAKLCSIYQKRFFSGENNSLEDENMMKSIEYIYHHYNKVITIDELLKIACLSRTAFLNKFKKITGSTPQELQSKYRIEISKNLLLQTTTTISSIAEEIGFYDLSHFSRVFIAKVGISPTEYRKQKGKK